MHVDNFSNIDSSSPLFQRIIKAGRNALIKKAHPDKGGSREELEEIEKAFKIMQTAKFKHEETRNESMARQQRKAFNDMAAQQNMNRYYQGW
jgi:hypothetical protein